MKWRPNTKLFFEPKQATQVFQVGPPIYDFLSMCIKCLSTRIV